MLCINKRLYRADGSHGTDRRHRPHRADGTDRPHRADRTDGRYPGGGSG